MRPMTPNRPSVIVVQRNPKQAGTLATGQRILQTKDGKPVVIVSKPPALMNNAIAGVAPINQDAQVPVAVSAAPPEEPVSGEGVVAAAGEAEAAVEEKPPGPAAAVSLTSSFY